MDLHCGLSRVQLSSAEVVFTHDNEHGRQKVLWHSVILTYTHYTGRRRSSLPRSSTPVSDSPSGPHRRCIPDAPSIVPRPELCPPARFAPIFDRSILRSQCSATASSSNPICNRIEYSSSHSDPGSGGRRQRVQRGQGR
ncbi:hypothetical protein K438DRAFT_1972425 [Mycena galopus ATCC 62051]|nr:hypothetical protein K438DRAFT_1972425 [Mycena galopus ATCC 62051]